MTKDRSLAVPLLDGLLKYWPFASKDKEPLFLTEVQEVLEVATVEKIEHLIRPLFHRIAKCISGDYMKVSDKAMLLFNNEFFMNALKHYKKIAFPILVPVINQLVDEDYHQKNWFIKDVIVNDEDNKSEAAEKIPADELKDAEGKEKILNYGRSTQTTWHKNLVVDARAV